MTGVHHDHAPPSSRVEREKSFYDSGDTRGPYARLRRRIWDALGDYRRNEDLDLFFDPRGKDVLHYGSGSTFGKELFERGAKHVTGIDISEVDIARARELAAEAGLADRTEFVAGDAHATPFADDSFDLVVGQSILHHLDLEVALRELRRIMRPGARGVFMEPLLHNPLLRLGRALTPSARTPDERPLTVADWQTCAMVFANFTHVERELISLPLVPLNMVLPRTLQRRMAPRVSALDDRILERFPRLRRYSRLTFLILE